METDMSSMTYSGVQENVKIDYDGIDKTVKRLKNADNHEEQY